MAASSSLWQLPSTKFLFNVSKIAKVRGVVLNPKLDVSRAIQTIAYSIVNGSYVQKAPTELHNRVKNKNLNTIDFVGAVQNLPMVMPSADVYNSALKKAKRVPPTKGILNIAKRERNKGAKQLDALMKSSTKKEARERLDEGMKSLEEVFKSQGKAVDELLNIAKALRAMPIVDLETPTLCLVGAPNVGKSSLVRLLSTGKPEICNYPFTTRGILMGHIHLTHQNFQVTDTPGILRRRDVDRNNLEKLTLAVLSHLPTAVLYVHDLSGECGTSPSDQYIIYKEIKERFSDHLWIDVVSKCDLLQESPVVYITEDSNADSTELARYRKMGPDGSLRVSVTSEVGIDELKSRVHEMLVSQLARIKIPDSKQEKVEAPKRFL